MLNTMKQLDVVITHWNEPWEIGKKLFDSIEMQECVFLEKVNFILVQDGQETALPWEELLSQYRYKVNVVTLGKHLGIAAARNAGLDYTETDWVMFMDFDDMFADIAALSMITRLFPVNEDTDVIWSKYVREVYDYGRYKYTTFNCEDTQDFRIIGKLYRTAFLKEKNIRFPAVCPEHCDLLFTAMVLNETYPFRIRNFYAPFYPFYKKYRKDGAFSTLAMLKKKTSGMFDRDAFLVSEMRNRNKPAAYNAWIVRTIADAYYMIRDASLEPAKNMGITPELIRFWKKYREDFAKVSPTDAEVSFDDSQTEAMSYIQEYYNYHGTESYIQNDMYTFEQFLNKLDELAYGIAEETAGQAEPASDVQDEPAPVQNIVPLKRPSEGKGRAVVYCGTKETYINMLASVKSLLATTPVDKVFFLIEDDEFPYEVPDVVEIRNVKDNNPFVPDGPNFVNAWTYMCLMRTAFPQMFPEYDKILSLDIDIVIDDNISNLWDIDLADYYYAGVPEQGRPENDYCNFGVIMMNLKKLRDDGMGDRLVNAVNTEHFGCPEQDAYNKYCHGHIYLLPSDYNVTVYSHITEEPLTERILHYAGLKYWKHFTPVKKYYNLSWEEIMNRQEALHG